MMPPSGVLGDEPEAVVFVENDEDAGLTIAEVLGRNQLEFRNRLREQPDDLVARASFRTASFDIDLQGWHVHIGRMRGVLHHHDLLGRGVNVFSRGGVEPHGVRTQCKRHFGLKHELQRVDQGLDDLFGIENDGDIGHVYSPVRNGVEGNYREITPKARQYNITKLSICKGLHFQVKLIPVEVVV